MQLREMKSWVENGRMVTIQDDVQGVVRQVREISGDRVKIFWNQQANEYDLVEMMEGRQSLVFSVKELDARVLTRLREADHWHGRNDPEHVRSDEDDFISQIEGLEEQDKADLAEMNREAIHDVGERLAWALEADGRGTKASISIPRSLNGDGSR